MWIEDKEDKIIREAKIKAQGACCYHKGHFDGESYFNGIMTVIVAGLFIGIICAIVSDFSKRAVQEYASEHPITVWSYPSPSTAPGITNGTTATTCDSNGRCTTQ